MGGGGGMWRFALLWNNQSNDIKRRRGGEYCFEYTYIEALIKPEWMDE